MTRKFFLSLVLVPNPYDRALTCEQCECFWWISVCKKCNFRQYLFSFVSKIPHSLPITSNIPICLPLIQFLFIVFSPLNFVCVVQKWRRAAVVQQFYQARVIDEFVLRGNAALLKCNLPSFVADFVSVEAWISDDGTEILPNSNDFGIPYIQHAKLHMLVELKQNVKMKTWRVVFVFVKLRKRSISSPFLNTDRKRNTYRVDNNVTPANEMMHIVQRAHRHREWYTLFDVPIRVHRSSHKLNFKSIFFVFRFSYRFLYIF